MLVFLRLSCVGQTEGGRGVGWGLTVAGRLLQAVTGYHNEAALLLGISSCLCSAWDSTWSTHCCPSSVCLSFSLNVLLFLFVVSLLFHSAIFFSSSNRHPCFLDYQVNSCSLSHCRQLVIFIWKQSSLSVSSGRYTTKWLLLIFITALLTPS